MLGILGANAHNVEADVREDVLGLSAKFSGRHGEWTGDGKDKVR